MHEFYRLKILPHLWYQCLSWWYIVWYVGTTWHTAGLVWRLRPNDTDIQLLNHMNHLVNNIEEETGINPGWINNGGLFIANNKVNIFL